MSRERHGPLSSYNGVMSLPRFSFPLLALPFVAGCFTPKLMSAARGREEHRPRSYATIVAREAVWDESGKLAICAVVTPKDGEAATEYTVIADRPHFDPGHPDPQRAEFAPASAKQGCPALRGSPIPVVQIEKSGELRLPPGAEEAVYSYTDAESWGLGYFSTRSFDTGRHSMNLDLTSTEIFTYLVDQKPLLFALVPVTLALDAPASVGMGLFLLACPLSKDCFH